MDANLERLLRTAEEPRLSSTHRAASCNALCGFLEKGFTSLNIELRDRCSHATVWNRTVTVYLEKSGHAKAKPMRQILVTLAKLLNQRQLIDGETGTVFDENVDIVRKKVISRCLTCIYSGDDLACVKAAMNILEMFLNKKVTNIPTMIEVFYFSHESAGIIGVPVTSTTPLNTNSSLSDPTKSSLNRFVTTFVSQVLHWIRYPDFGPAVGHLLKGIFESLHDHASRSKSASEEIPPPPQWAESIRQLLRNRPDLLEVVGHYVLPDLLCLDMCETTSFICSLPFDDLMGGMLSSLREEDIRLCLLVVQLAENLSLSKPLSKLVRKGT